MILFTGIDTTTNVLKKEKKLRNLDVRASILQTFYRCFIESVITFSLMCWFGSLSVRNRNVFSKVNVCSKVVGERQANLSELYDCRVVRKVRMITIDNSHVFALRVGVSVLQNSEPSGQRTVLSQSLFSSSTSLITDLHYQFTSRTWLLSTFCIVHERMTWACIMNI